LAQYWGFHALFDAAGCDPKLIDDADNIRAFTKDLVEAIEMVAYGEPQVVWFAGHDPSKAGYTLTQMIETSLISAHFVPAFGEVYLDVFSCKPFSSETAESVFRRYFKPERVAVNFLTRRA
jgi:S-adenosylmethionine/arginine decarboxylase-like enzyme